jgi:hypothetical protein
MVVPRPRVVMVGPRPRVVMIAPRPRAVMVGPKPRVVMVSPRSRVLLTPPLLMRPKVSERCVSVVSLGVNHKHDGLRLALVRKCTDIAV